MSTMNQFAKSRVNVVVKFKTSALCENSLRWGVCVQVMTRTNKKPNSDIPKVTKVRLTTRIQVITDEGQSLKEQNIVLVPGGSVKELSGVRCHIVCGDFDCFGVKKRR
jgi:small subunit ribosomal protein S12